MTFARKINKIPEFYTIFARKMPEFYIGLTIARKIFPDLFFLGGGHVPPTPSFTPMIVIIKKCCDVASGSRGERLCYIRSSLGHAV